MIRWNSTVVGVHTLFGKVGGEARYVYFRAVSLASALAVCEAGLLCLGERSTFGFTTIVVAPMTRTKKADSVPSQMARLQNRLINYQEQAQEINPPDVEALGKQVEAENGALRRRVGDVKRRRIEEAEELEEENRELEEENREWQRRMEEINKNRRIILQIIFVSILIFFVNKILKFFEIL
ncbi:hypothetical protein C2G38_2035522 [Gigaspora rosea]|uniref:Uncharacterized protein n=1 Tax=Gigaspora rosea TaxID=44941 RepID=A0A397VDM2_9GLOM|nr:hypothetical protein C2G38_2035522 [Gigaspora rosea]